MHAKRTNIRKKLPAKSSIFALNKIENTCRLFTRCNSRRKTYIAEYYQQSRSF